MCAGRSLFWDITGCAQDSAMSIVYLTLCSPHTFYLPLLCLLLTPNSLHSYLLPWLIHILIIINHSTLGPGVVSPMCSTRLNLLLLIDQGCYRKMRLILSTRPGRRTLGIRS